MKDLCFVTGLILGAGIGMVVAAKNKQVKKIVEDSEQCLCEAMDEVKQYVTEPICECMNNVNNSKSNKASKNKQKASEKKQNSQKIEK